MLPDRQLPAGSPGPWFLLPCSRGSPRPLPSGRAASSPWLPRSPQLPAKGRPGPGRQLCQRSVSAQSLSYGGTRAPLPRGFPGGALSPSRPPSHGWGARHQPPSRRRLRAAAIVRLHPPAPLPWQWRGGTRRCHGGAVSPPSLPGR